MRDFPLIADVDFATSVEEALEFCTTQGVEVVDFEACGPGGGNPCLDIRFTSEAQMRAFATAYCTGSKSPICIVGGEPDEDPLEAAVLDFMECHA